MKCLSNKDYMKTFKSIEKLLNGYGYVLSEKTLSSSFCAKTYKYVIYQEKGFKRVGRIYYQPYIASCDLEIRDPLKIDIKCQYVDSLYRKLERLLKEVE